MNLRYISCDYTLPLHHGSIIDFSITMVNIPMDKLLTIGMATFDDYDGVFFSIQALRMYHDICNTAQVEFVVIDNNPTGPHANSTKNFMSAIKGKYIPYGDNVSSFTKYRVPDYATGKYVLIMDSHVMLAQNSIAILLDYYRQTPDCKNLVQGPLLYDDLANISTACTTAAPPCPPK